MTEGRVLAGRYELQHPLGRGGMAEVWAAHDQVLGRDVAVKILLERFRDDEGFIQRFQDEARHVAQLNHPNIVAVYDTGTADAPESSSAGTGGRPFIVMELVEGRSMQDAIAAGGLTEDRTLEVCAEVCAGLQYAHDRGLVHRDIKPGNILLAEDGAVKVTDFGIARAIDSDTVTRTAAVLGTAAYLSPEQAQGLELDARSDLYSLGVVLYEALTGHQPFRGDSPVTVAYQHVQEPPRPPHEWTSDISPAAEAVTMRALAKNPANRYPTASDLRVDLLNARSGQAVAAPPVLAAEETALLDTDAGAPVHAHQEQRTRRRWVYVLLALLAVLAVVLGIWYVASVLAGDDGPQVSVPEVVGLSLEQAETTLTEEGLELGDVEEEPSDEVDEGLVLRQSPAAQQLASEGSEVDLVVSTGAPMTEVPDLEGVDEDTAIGLLREAELRPGDRAREPSDDLDAGEIISTDPPAGTEVAEGSSVDYVVSTGEETVVVRSVVNFTEGDAISRLEEQGLEVRIDREFNDVVAEGTVIRQQPTPGTEVERGETVTVVVSRGSQEPDEPEEPPAPPEPEEPEEPEDDDDDDGGEDEDEDGLLGGGVLG